MNLIDRYIYAVTKSFADKQRAEIEKELRANIEDMVELNMGPESDDDKVKKALLALGDPEAIADAYRGSQRYLIGPRYYETYLLVLKIVTGAVLGGVSIAIFIESFFATDPDIAKLAVNYLASLFGAALQAFAWTTISFAIAERIGAKDSENASGKGKWDLSQLPVLPPPKAVISLAESIVSIVFTTVFYSVIIILLYSAPDVFAAYLSEGGEIVIIPIFDADAIQRYTGLFIAIFVVSILKEVLKLYYRRWMLKLAVICIILTALATGMALMIFTDPGIWNPNFAADVARYSFTNFDFAGLWAKIKTAPAVIIVFTGVLEIITALVKGLKYDVKH